MAETPKVLGQSDPSATTLTDIYTVPASTYAVLSSIVVANRSATPTTVRISVAVGGAADSNEQYLFYDVALAANTTLTFVLGITLQATDVVRGYVGAATVSINLFGVEIT